MFPVVVRVGIFILFCLPASVLANSSLLFLVDVTIPQKEGRQESDDIVFINNTLNELTGINVYFSRKAFDNQKVFLVLDAQEICSWSSLTFALSSKGYRLSVTPLQRCSDYAMELGVNVTYRQMNEVQEIQILEFFDVIFYDEGITTDDFNAMVKSHFEIDKVLMEEYGDKGVCFRSLAHLPVRLIYFGLASPKELKILYKKVRMEGKASIKLRLLQSFKIYADTC